MRLLLYLAVIAVVVAGLVWGAEGLRDRGRRLRSRDRGRMIDQGSLADAAQAMATAIPGARLAVVPGAGHLTPMERPEATTALLADFLTGLGLQG